MAIVMVEELAKGHQSYRFHPTETSAKDMCVQPFVIISCKLLVRNNVVFAHHFPPLRKLIIETHSVLTTSLLRLFISKLIRLLVGPQTNKIDIPGHVIDHMVPNTLFVYVHPQHISDEHPMLPVDALQKELLFVHLYKLWLTQGYTGAQQQMFGNASQHIIPCEILGCHEASVLESILQLKDCWFYAGVYPRSLLLQQLYILVQIVPFRCGWDLHILSKPLSNGDRLGWLHRFQNQIVYVYTASQHNLISYFKYPPLYVMISMFKRIDQRDKKQFQSSGLETFKVTLKSSTSPLIKSYRSQQNELTCSICLKLIKYLEMVSQTLTCSHIFHQHCLEEWIRLRINCPYCRATLLPSQPQGLQQFIKQLQDESDP